MAGHKLTKTLVLIYVFISFAYLWHTFLETPWLWIFVHMNNPIYVYLIKNYPKGDYHGHIVHFPTYKGRWPHFKTVLNMLSSPRSV